MSLLKMDEVAERLGMQTKSGAYHLIHRVRDPLPAFRTGERCGYRVDEGELAAWLDRNRVSDKAVA